LNGEYKISIEEKVCVRSVMGMMNYATELILKEDVDFKKKIEALNEKIQYKVGDDINYLMTISNGKLTGEFTSDNGATLVFEFDKPGTYLESFTATEADISKFMDKVKVSDINKANEMIFVTQTLADYLKDMMTDGGDHKILTLKCMMYNIMNCVDEIAKVDEDLKEEIEDMDGSIQWKLGDEINAYQAFEDGKYSWAIDAELDNPEVTVKVKDLDLARGVLSGSSDFTAAYMSGDVVVEGNLQLLMGFGTITEFLLDYLQPLTELN